MCLRINMHSYNWLISWSLFGQYWLHLSVSTRTYWYLLSGWHRRMFKQSMREWRNLCQLAWIVFLCLRKRMDGEYHLMHHVFLEEYHFSEEPERVLTQNLDGSVLCRLPYPFPKVSHINLVLFFALFPYPVYLFITYPSFPSFLSSEWNFNSHRQVKINLLIRHQLCLN